MTWDDRYKLAIASYYWQVLKRDIVFWCRSRCQRCKSHGPLELHHLHYHSLGRERPEDVEALCKACHKIADSERAVEGRRRSWDARLDGWASRKYGEDWADAGDGDSVAEEFEEWLEQAEGYDY